MKCELKIFACVISKCKINLLKILHCVYQSLLYDKIHAMLTSIIHVYRYISSQVSKDAAAFLV
jgi:hypothetical protein